MAAPKGNQFWKARSKHGRNKIFKSPDILWEAACEYFQWVEDNPLWEDKVTSYQGVNTHEPMAKMHAMTHDGLCIFLDISLETWARYRKTEDFREVTTRIEKIIRHQKFAGAAAELLNPNIIARDLGLHDKVQVDATIQDERETSTLELAKAAALLLSEGIEEQEETRH